MQFLLPLLYALLLGWLICKMGVFKDEKLSRGFFLFIFFLKILLGILYISIFTGGDIVSYFGDSDKIIYPTLWQNPLKYLYLTLGPSGGKIPDFVSHEVYAMGYWGDYSDYMVVRFNALVRLLSFGNFYVHGVFISFVSLLGLTWIYRAYVRTTGSFSIPIVASIFMIPSVLFWSSGVHKEGILLFAMGLLLYGCALLVQRFSTKNFIIALTGGLLTFLIRNYVLLLLLPGIIAFFATSRNYLRIRFLVPVIYLVIIALIVFIPMFGGENLVTVISAKQHEFEALDAGTTQISVKNFKPSVLSLLINLPQALRNSLLGPFFVSPTKAMHYLIIIENAILLLAGFLFPWITGKPRLQPFMLMCLLFSISLLVLIGYIVPNVGAIVRYRSIALPFLFIFLYSGEKAGFSAKS